MHVLLITTVLLLKICQSSVLLRRVAHPKGEGVFLQLSDMLCGSVSGTYSLPGGYPSANVIMLIYSEVDEKVVTAVKALSAHGIATVLVDLLGHKPVQLICRWVSSAHTQLVILSFTNVSLQSLCPGYCIGHTSSADSADRPLPNRTCQNILWLDQGLCGTRSESIYDYNGIEHPAMAEFDPEWAQMTHLMVETTRLLRNKTIKVATLPPDVGPFVEHCDNVGTAYCGIVFEMLNYLSRHFNFKYEVVTDASIGIINEDGESNGIVGLAQRKEVDIAAYDITITDSRKEIIDFGPPFYSHSSSIMVLAPEGQRKVRLLSWTDPFRWPVWICLSVSLTLVTLVLHCGHTFSAPWLWADTKFQDIGQCVTYVGRGTIGQGVELSPRSWWSQTLLTIWWIFCLLEIATYGSFLVATLTAPSPRVLPFYTLKELALMVSKREYKVCMPGGTVFYDGLMKSDASDFKAISIWLRSYQKYITNSSGACIQIMTQEQNVAFIDRTSTLEQFQRRACGQNQFIILEERLYTRPVSFGFPKHSPYTAVFSKKITHITEQGLMDAWYRNYSRNSDKCNVTEVTDLSIRKAQTKKLDLYDLAGVFAIFGAGVVVSCIFLFLEFGRKRQVNR